MKTPVVATPDDQLFPSLVGVPLVWGLASAIVSISYLDLSSARSLLVGLVAYFVSAFACSLRNICVAAMLAASSYRHSVLIQQNEYTERQKIFGVGHTQED